MWMEGGKMTKQANKQSIILPFFPVKGGNCILFQGAFRPFLYGWGALFCVILRTVQKFSPVFY